MQRVALLSFHGCPVARLGEKDTGGMNVYVQHIARELARLGYRVDVYTRRHDPGDPQVIELADGAKVVHLDGGPYDDSKKALYNHIPGFIEDLYAYQRPRDSNTTWSTVTIGCRVRSAPLSARNGAYRTSPRCTPRRRPSSRRVPERTRRTCGYRWNAGSSITWTL